MRIAYLGIALTGLVSTLSASTCSSLCEEHSCLEECDCSCSRFPTKTITPDGVDYLGSCLKFGISGDFIYWAVREDDLSFVANNNTGVFSSSLDWSKIENFQIYEYPTWKMVAGYKAAVDLTLGHDGWDLFCEYTRLTPSNMKRKATVSQLIFSPVIRAVSAYSIFRPNNTVPSIVVNNCWSLHFKVIDLALGRSFFISSRLILRPHIGLKATSQKQKDQTTVENYLGDFSPDFSFLFTGLGSIYHQDTMKYKGVGMRAGLDTSWFFYESFSLFGNLAGTALWEFFQMHSKEYIFFPEIETNSYYLTGNYHDTFHTVCPILEGEIGARFEAWFGEGGCKASLEVGWELQWWNGQNKIGTFDFLGNLLMQGVTASLRLDF